MDFEAVSDSSRYFVVRLRNDNGQTAFVGVGFADRSDSFDLNVAVQDHFKGLERDTQLAKEASSRPKLDLGFKDGQTININIGVGLTSLYLFVRGSKSQPHREQSGLPCSTAATDRCRFCHRRPPAREIAFDGLSSRTPCASAPSLGNHDSLLDVPCPEASLTSALPVRNAFRIPRQRII